MSSSCWVACSFPFLPLPCSCPSCCCCAATCFSRSALCRLTVLAVLSIKACDHGSGWLVGRYTPMRQGNTVCYLATCQNCVSVLEPTSCNVAVWPTKKMARLNFVADTEHEDCCPPGKTSTVSLCNTGSSRVWGSGCSPAYRACKAASAAVYLQKSTTNKQSTR
jgi:hypothetical protein